MRNACLFARYVVGLVSFSSVRDVYLWECVCEDVLVYGYVQVDGSWMNGWLYVAIYVFISVCIDACVRLAACLSICPSVFVWV